MEEKKDSRAVPASAIVPRAYIRLVLSKSILSGLPNALSPLLPAWSCRMRATRSRRDNKRMSWLRVVESNAHKLAMLGVLPSRFYRIDNGGNWSAPLLYVGCWL